MGTAHDRYVNHTYSESRDRGRAEHAARDLADQDTDLVCQYCGQPERNCEAAQDGHSITLITRLEYETTGGTWNH